MSSDYASRRGVDGEDVAEQFVADELLRSRKRLQMTQIVGTVLVVILSGTMIFITSGFASALSPKGASEISTGIIKTQIETKGTELSAQVQDQVKSALEKAPDQLIESMPKYREQLETQFETELKKHAQEQLPKLTEALGTYLDEHEEEMKAVVETSADAESLKKLSPSLRAELKKLLTTKQDTGESINDQLVETLAKLKEIHRKTTHLATAKVLTPEEKRLRRAMGIITHTVSKSNLQPLALPTLTSEATEASEAPTPPGPGTAAPPGPATQKPPGPATPKTP